MNIPDEVIAPPPPTPPTPYEIKRVADMLEKLLRRCQSERTGLFEAAMLAAAGESIATAARGVGVVYRTSPGGVTWTTEY